MILIGSRHNASRPCASPTRLGRSTRLQTCLHITFCNHALRNPTAETASVSRRDILPFSRGHCRDCLLLAHIKVAYWPGIVGVTRLLYCLRTFPCQHGECHARMASRSTRTESHIAGHGSNAAGDACRRRSAHQRVSGLNKAR